MGSPVIWNGRTGKNLSPDGMKAKNGRQELYLEVDPRTTATDANQGDFLSSIYGKFQKLDNGSSTNWKRIDAEVSPYKLYDSFEMDTVASLPANWTKYGNTDTALNYPDNFGGTASASSYTTVANTGLSGANLFRASVSSSDNGKGVYKSFSIANGEKGLPFIFESQINITKLGSAEWASNAQVWVVGSNDNFVSNFQNIPLTNYVVSKSGLLKGSFIDSSATLTNFRLCIHFSGLTDTFNVDFDEVKIYSGAQDTLSSIVSEWFSYTPTFQGFGTVTNINIKYRQVGSNYEFIGAFNSGTPSGSGVYGFTLPNGSTISNGIYDDAMFGSVAFSQVFGNGQNTFLGGRRGESYINLYINSTTTGYTRVSTSGPLPTSGATYYIQATVPIQGLNQFGSNVIASSENFMPIRSTKNSGQTVGTTRTELTWDNNLSDPRFTTSSRFKLVPNAIFSIDVCPQLTPTQTWISLEVYKNGSAISDGIKSGYRETQGGAVNAMSYTVIINTNGDIDSDVYSIAMRVASGTSTVGTGFSKLDINRLDKPFSMNLFQAGGMVLSPTDNVLPAQFSRSTTQSIPNGANTTVVCDTTQFNPTGSIALNTSTGRFTNNGPSGYYKLSGLMFSTNGITGSSNTVIKLLRSVNGGATKEIGLDTSITSGVGYWGVPFSTIVYLASGSYVDLQFFQNTGSAMSIQINEINVERVDKTAVGAGGGYTKWQRKNLSADTTATGTVSSLSFNNLEIGKTYRATLSTHPTQSTGTVSRYSFINGTKIGELSFYAAGAHAKSIVFVSISTTLTIDAASNDYGLSAKTSTDERTCLILEELPQHIQTNQWT